MVNSGTLNSDGEDSDRTFGIGNCGLQWRCCRSSSRDQFTSTRACVILPSLIFVVISLDATFELGVPGCLTVHSIMSAICNRSTRSLSILGSYPIKHIKVLLLRARPIELGRDIVSRVWAHLYPYTNLLLKQLNEIPSTRMQCF